MTLNDLIRAEPDAVALDLDRRTARHRCAAEADVPEVARMMTDYNLIAIPVVDSDGRAGGVIAVDDVLELLAARGVAAPDGGSARLRARSGLGVARTAQRRDTLKWPPIGGFTRFTR